VAGLEPDLPGAVCYPPLPAGPACLGHAGGPAPILEPHQIRAFIHGGQTGLADLLTP
jgi:hypothetical protein